MILSLIALFSQCKQPLREPDASYVFYLSGDSTKTNITNITVLDQVIFKNANANGADYYTIFTGNTPENVYKFGIGINMIKGADGIFRTQKLQFKVPGSYKIYMIATTVNLSTGERKEKIDSNTIITVTNPDLTKAIITAFPMTAGGKKMHGATGTTTAGIPINPIVTADSILFLDVNPAYSKLFLACIFSPIATSDIILINDTAMSVNTSAGNYLYDGSKIKIIAKEGSESKTYSVAIRYYVAPPSRDSTIKSATVIQGSLSTTSFSGTAIISGNTITLPSWPKGTPDCIVTLKTTGVADQIIPILKTDMPKKVTSTAQCGGSAKMDYFINAPTTELDATISALTLTKNKGGFLMNPVTGGYAFSLTNAWDLDSAKIKISTNQFATIQYDTLSDYSTARSFTSESTLVKFSKFSTVYFKTKNGTDTKTFFIKMSLLQ